MIKRWVLFRSPYNRTLNWHIFLKPQRLEWSFFSTIPSDRQLRPMSTLSRPNSIIVYDSFIVSLIHWLFYWVNIVNDSMKNWRQATGNPFTSNSNTINYHTNSPWNLRILDTIFCCISVSTYKFISILTENAEIDWKLA